MPYTQTPAVTDTTALQARVARYTQSPDDAEVLVMALDGIHDAENRLNTRVWKWSKATVNLTLNVTSNTYVVAATFKAPRHMEILDVNGNVIDMLGYKDPKTFQLDHTNRTGSSSPSFYTLLNTQYDGLVTLDAYPSAGFIAVAPLLRLHFYQRLQTAADGSNLAIPREVETFVEWHAKMYLASMEGDMDRVGFAERQSEKAWAMLRHDDLWSEARDYSEGGKQSTLGGGQVISTGGIGIPSGNTLPTAANRGDFFLLLGPPDILYCWMALSDGVTEDWIEQSMAP